VRDAFAHADCHSYGYRHSNSYGDVHAYTHEPAEG
jgi:hypothetical protein